MQPYKARLGLLAVVAAVGCAGGSQVTLRIHEQVGAALPAEHVRVAELPKFDLKIPVDPYPALSEKDVQAAEIRPTPGGDAVLVRFNIESAMRLEELTVRNRGRYLVVFWNDRPVEAWLVDRGLTNGQLLVEGDFTDEEAAQIVRGLNQIARKNR